MFILPAALTQVSPAQATTVSCGDRIVSGRPLTVTLTADLNCSPGTGLSISSDNAFIVTLDLAGHTVSGNLLVNTPSQVVVKNGRLSALDASRNTTVTLSDVQGVSLNVQSQAVVAAGGTPSTCEIDYARVSQARLTVDRCTLHNGSFYQSTPTVRSSTVSDGHLAFTDSGNGLFTGNVFDNAPVSVGWESVDFTFRDNVFKNADTALDVSGIARGPWSSGTIERNEFSDNSIGLRAAPYFDKMTVQNNLFARNRTVGLYIDNQAVPRQSYPVSDNVFLDNGQAPSGAADRLGNLLQGGIHVLNAAVTGGPPYPRITLARNTGSGNAGYLIWRVDAQVHDGGGNQGPCGPPSDDDMVCS